MLSPLDDYPVHQIAEVMRHVGTGDRNFYDRYYFNCHRCGDDLFLVTGMGQYPNLGVVDAFAVVRRGPLHRVVRASRELGDDRMDTTVGPFRVEVLEGLKRLRVVLDETPRTAAGDAAGGGLSFDLTFTGAVPAVQEPRHFIRQHERVVFDSMRLAQTGCWTGALRVGGEDFEVTPDRWWGSRDRSWGVRPVGEAEPPGIRAAKPPGNFFWIYAPMQFPDFTIFAIVQEDEHGRRILEEAVRVWPEAAGREPEWLGRPEHRLEYVSGTRDVRAAVLSFEPPGGKPLEVGITPVLPLHVGVGTGYGLENDWRHGMYQGPLKVETVELDLRRDADRARMWGIVDNVARFECQGAVGWGLFEVMVLGPHHPSGFATWEAVAP